MTFLKNRTYSFSTLLYQASKSLSINSKGHPFSTSIFCANNVFSSYKVFSKMNLNGKKCIGLNLLNNLKGSMEKRSKSIFKLFELLPLSYKRCAKLYIQKTMYKYSEIIAIGHFKNRLLLLWKSHQKLFTIEK